MPLDERRAGDSEEEEEERGDDTSATDDDGLSSGVSGTEAPPISPAWRRFKTVAALVFIALIAVFLVLFIMYGYEDERDTGGGILGSGPAILNPSGMT